MLSNRRGQAHHLLDGDEMILLAIEDVTDRKDR
jgi:hypothetical protein